jgi:hypothetical protein
VMRKTLLLAFVSIFAVASVALAATNDKAPKASLVQAVNHTNRAPSMRYVLDISITRPNAPAMSLHVKGVRGRGSLFIHVAAMAGASAGPQQSAMIDGPFLYEGSPNGVAIVGKVRWLRLPIARIGSHARPIETIHSLSPAPLLHVLDEWAGAKRRSPDGSFHGVVAYDDPIVQTALSGIADGIQFRDVFFTARIGADGYLHTIGLTGRTADGTRTLRVTAHLFAFGRPVTLHLPGEGAFMDQKLIGLAE